MTKIIVLALLALLCISYVAACSCGKEHEVEKRDAQHNDPNYFVFTGTETINGVSAATRIKWMNYAMQTRFNAQGPCPRDAFGAVLVHRPTDTALCATTTNRNPLDATDHAEIRIIRECSAILGRNRTAWQEVSLYTTGESCPMCMSATVWAGVGENIYASTIDKLVDMNWTQIMISSKKVGEKAVDGNVLPPTLVINYKPKGFYDQYFAWQFDTTAPCPGGCVRNVTTNACYLPTTF